MTPLPRPRLPPTCPPLQIPHFWDTKSHQASYGNPTQLGATMQGRSDYTLLRPCCGTKSSSSLYTAAGYSVSG